MWLIWLEGGPHNSLCSGQAFPALDKSVLGVVSFRVVPLWAHILADKERNCKYIHTNSVLPMFSGLRSPEICSLPVSSINQPWKFRAVTWSPGAVPPPPSLPRLLSHKMCTATNPRTHCELSMDGTACTASFGVKWSDHEQNEMQTALCIMCSAWDSNITLD